MDLDAINGLGVIGTGRDGETVEGLALGDADRDVLGDTLGL